MAASFDNSKKQRTNIMLITTALVSGLIMATILTVFILASLAKHPRIWLVRSPKPIQEALPPANDEDKRLMRLWAIPIFGITFLMPLACAFWYERSYQPMTYFEAVLFLWIMSMCFNLADLIIIDWLVVVWWQPDWSTLPEVKALIRQHAGYAYHFKASLRGTVMLAVFALLFALPAS